MPEMCSMTNNVLLKSLVIVLCHQIMKNTYKWRTRKFEMFLFIICEVVPRARPSPIPTQPRSLMRYILGKKRNAPLRTVQLSGKSQVIGQFSLYQCKGMSVTAASHVFCNQASKLC